MEDIYTVEKIVSSRIKNGKKQYYVKWEGYSSDQNTWEDEKNIFCKNLIDEYENKQQKKTTKSKAKSVIYREVSNEWDKHVKQVVAVEKDESKLIVRIEFENGKEGVVPIEQAHTKFPLHLLKYYEDNIVFD